MKKLLLCATVILTALVLNITNSLAALIAYEGFDYTQNTQLNLTTNTGTGWTNSWNNGGAGEWRTNAPVFSEITTGLTYTGLATVGEAARNANGFNTYFRSFASQSATGTYYIGFLMQKDDALAGTFGISLYNGASEQNYLGQAGNGTVFATGGSAAPATSAITVTTTPSFFVARLNMSTGTAHYWVNPVIANGTPADSAAFNGLPGTSFTAFSFDNIRISQFGGAQGYLDEIRIGNTFADVIPEPSTYVLLVLGLASLFFLRRRNVA